jgi:opacity protein-like surface antigen
MKMRILFSILFFSAVALTGGSLQAQAVQKGNVMLDVYYGFPNLTTGVLRAVAKNVTNDPNLKVTGMGPFGAKASYMITDDIGLGLDFYYASSGFEYTNSGIDSTGAAFSYHYSLKNPRPRFLARFDYHFGNSEIVDLYGSAGLGYSGAKYKLVTDDPIFDLSNYALRGIRSPIAYRLAFGTKIYFVQYFGVTAEIGLGGPLLTVGLSGKF